MPSLPYLVGRCVGVCSCSHSCSLFSSGDSASQDTHTHEHVHTYTIHTDTHMYIHIHTHISEIIGLSLLKGLGSLYYVGLPFWYSRILNYTEHTCIYYSMFIKVEHALPNALRVRLTFFCLFVEALTPFGKYKCILSQATNTLL